MYRFLVVVCLLSACGPETHPGATGGSGGGMADASVMPDAPNITNCGGQPTDTNMDSANCGGCGQACPASFTCVQGSCTNDPGFYIGGLSNGSPDHATVAGQAWVILEVGGMHAGAPGTPDAPMVTFGDIFTADGAVAPAALGDWRAGASNMYATGGPNADLAHVTAIAPAHTAGTVPITVQQGTRRAIRLQAFRYDRAILPMMWTTRGKLSPGQGDPDGQLLGFLVGRADRPATSIIPDGRVVVGGGNCAANSWCAGWNMVEIYDPPTGVSHVAPGNLAVGRAWIESITLVDGRVLMAGGIHATTGCGAAPTFDAPTHTETCPYTGNTNASSVNLVAAVTADLYVPQVNQVVAAGDMNHARSGHTMTLLNDGRVLIVGGSELNHWANPPAGPSVEVFDPVSNTFSAPATTLPGLVDHAAGRTREGDVIVAGGRTTATQPNPSAASFKVSVAADGSLQVASLPALPKAEMDGDPGNTLVLTPTGDVVMAPGAASDATGPLLVYRASTQIWDMPAVTTPLKYWPGVALLGDGTVMSCGGEDATCGGTTTCVSIDPATFQVATFSALATLVRESPMVVLPSGGAMMTGGTSGATPTDCGGDAANNTLSVLLP
jgi:hypothetical protein